MPETIEAIETAKHYVKFNRKINDGNYGGTEAEVLIAVPLPATASGEEIIEALQRNFAMAESLVFEQLQREYTLNEQGVVVEIAETPAGLNVTPDDVSRLRETFGGGELLSDREVQQLNAAGSNVVQGNFGSKAEPYDAAWVKSLGNKEQREWAEARYAVAPNEFWDNTTSKRNPNAPDFKHKETGAAFWLQKRNNG